MNLNPSQAPTCIQDKEKWFHHVPGDVTVGDLWLLSWDQVGLGLILITVVEEDFVVGWPVTLPNEPVYPPAVIVESDLGPVHAWPTRETGIGIHLLHRRFGNILEAAVIKITNRAIDQGEIFPNLVDTSIYSTDTIISHSEEMIRKWADICFHQWPEALPGETPFNQLILQELKIKPSDLSRVLDLTVLDANALHRGSAVPSVSQLQILSNSLNVDIESLISPSLDDGTRLLIQPQWKVSLLEAAATREVDEATARRSVQTGYAYAARSNGSPNDKMAAAIQRFKSETEG